MNDKMRRFRDIVTSRMVVRWIFLAFFLVAVWQLLAFVRWAKGLGPYVPRPEAVAGLLPVGHFTSFFAWVKGGGWDTLLPAGLVIIIAAIAVSFLFKRAFCGWICPLGTVWETAGLLGRKLLGGKNIRMPHWLDVTGRTFRYLLSTTLLLFLMVVSVEEAVGFRQYEYMWVADIKIISGFASLTFVLLFLLAFVLSMLFGSVWCRWLCPLGGWYSVVGMASPFVIRRNNDNCIHCRRCDASCHAFVDVEGQEVVRAAECDGCMDCVKVCPAEDCLDARGPGGFHVAPWVWPLLVAGLWLAIYGFAKFTGNWDTTIPDEVFRQVINSGLLEQRTPGGL